MSRLLVIYHGGCRDGFAAAWVCERRWRDLVPDFHAGYYGQSPPDVTGRDVVLVDFSYPLAEMDLIASQATSLLVLDHHKTAEETLRDFKRPSTRIVFDINRSGAGLAWDDWHPKGDRPMVVDYIEDRDLWRFALPYSREVNAYLSTLPLEFDAWTNAETNAVQDGFEAHDRTLTARDRGKWVIAKTDQYVREAAKNARRVKFGTADGGYHDVPIVNAPQIDISELLDHLVAGEPFAVGWWQRSDGVFQYSLRSRGDFDVSVIAKAYGGGGHKNAAGFQSRALLDLPVAP